MIRLIDFAVAVASLLTGPGPLEQAAPVEGTGPPEASRQESSQEVAVPAPASGVLREEFFVIEALPEALAAGADLTLPHPAARTVGLAACRRRNDADGRMLEWELDFHDDEVRVLHVERDTTDGPRLVWREWQSGRGRTVTIEPTADGGGRILEWGQEEPVRSLLAPGATLPLGLLERLRTGAVESGTFQVFDPMSRQLESLRVHLDDAGPRALRAVSSTGQPGGGAPAQRLVELRRADGSVAGRYLFEGADLAAFQWQAGHLRARRVEAADYLRRSAEAGLQRGGD